MFANLFAIAVSENALIADYFTTSDHGLVWEPIFSKPVAGLGVRTSDQVLLSFFMVRVQS